ncbi:MAG TPA: DUF5615 family PIN-like protein [Candidatus Acidoferrales bacterium]|jgi:hypothetical protein|nr:DUF5615 family PIN-like protein [Candidatus Acidoferrales bacterium]
MKILIDECAPRELSAFLANRGHQCLTVQDQGWSGNLALAESTFEVLVTVDTNLEYQQNIAARNISVVVLICRSNRLVDLRPLFPLCATAIETIQSGDVVLVGK